MNKTGAIQAVIATTKDEPVIFTTGYSCRIARHIADRPNHFYMTGSMGLAASVGIGVAMGTGLKTVVVDGDGSLLMNPVGLVVAGAMDQLPLIHLVLDDGRYASTGGQTVPSSRTDLSAWARGAGYQHVVDVSTTDALVVLLSRELSGSSYPIFIHCLLEDQDEPVPSRVGADLPGYTRRFSDHIRARASAPSSMMRSPI